MNNLLWKTIGWIFFVGSYMLIMLRLVTLGVMAWGLGFGMLLMIYTLDPDSNIQVS